jgi:dihydrodiol dehydrogenase / D-xylose 1-dehydrogenase (NADP)
MMRWKLTDVRFEWFYKTSQSPVTMTTPAPPPLDDTTISNPLACPPLRWGIVGCGRVSHDYVQALKHVPTAQVVACAARRLEDAQQFAKQHGIEHYCK